MSESGPSAPAGWYPGPDGGQRYWDGERWLALPAPAAEDGNLATQASGASSSVAMEDSSSSKSPRKPLIIGLAIAAVLIVVGGGAAVAIKAQSDQAAAEEAAEAEEVAQAEEAAERQRQAEAAADQRERESRTSAIDEIEGSIQGMAETHVTEGLIDGPIISVSCDPVDGGSADDLTQRTTVFQCFAANTDNGDGSFSGHYYNATMNWDSGEYTYGFGAPN